MVSSGFFVVFCAIGIIGAWITLAFCAYVSIKEYRAGTLWRSRD